MQYQGLTLQEHNGTFYFEDPELAQKHTGSPGSYEPFIKKYGLKVSAASRHPSINHLLKGRIGFKQVSSGYGYKNLYDEMQERPDALGWFDHTKLFHHKESQNYVLTTQPYDLTLEQFQALERFCQEQGLACRISYTEAWWYPGSTPLVIVCRPEAMSVIFG